MKGVFRMLAGFLVFPAVVLASDPARGEVAVTLKLDRSEATTADAIQMTVSLSGTRQSDSHPVVRGLEDFVVNRAGTSTRVEIVNGRYSAAVDYSFFLQPKKTGTFRVGPAEVTVDGKTYRSAVETLTVVGQAKSGSGSAEPIFLIAAVSAPKLYVEQQAFYSLKLYRAAKVSDLSLNLPEADGVSFHKIGEPREYQGVYQGRSYQILEVRYVLIPQKAGRLKLSPAGMDMTIYVRQDNPHRGFFDDPFFGSFASGRPLSLNSNALEVQVLPLPQEGKPADFSGLVGVFDMESKLEPQAIKAGESATLTVTVSGRGAVKRIPEVKMPAMDGIKVYADQPVLVEEMTGEGMTGSKTMKWALVPEREGRYPVPQLALSFFDPEAGIYKVLRTQARHIAVSSGGQDVSPPLRSEARSETSRTKIDVADLGRDIMPPHSSIRSTSFGRFPILRGLSLWLAVCGPAAAYIMTLGGARFHRRRGALTAAVSVRKAVGDFLRRHKRGGGSAEELMAALQDYLSRRLDLSSGALTPDEAADLLRSRGVSEDKTEPLRLVLRKLEDAIYTGKGREKADVGGNLPDLIRRIDRDLR